MATKNSYIDQELDWLESRANEIKSYIDKNPYDKITERVISLSGPKGSYDKVVATIEQQQKAHRDSLKDYSSILEVIDKLREQEKKKEEFARGGHNIPHRMKSDDEEEDDNQTDP